MRTQKNSRFSAAIVVICFVLMLSLAGCPQNKWQSAANASDGLILSVQSAQNVEIGFHNAGKIEASEHIKAQQTFKKLAELDKALNVSIKAGSLGGSQAAFNAALLGTEDALNDGSLSFSNPDVAVAVQGAISSTRVILASIQTIATGK